MDVKWSALLLNVCNSLHCLFDCTVSDAVSLEHKSLALVNVAVARLLWEIGTVPGVRVRQKQVQNNQDSDENKDGYAVHHL